MKKDTRSKEQKEYDEMMAKLEKQQADARAQAQLDNVLGNWNNSRSTHYQSCKTYFK